MTWNQRRLHDEGLSYWNMFRVHGVTYDYRFNREAYGQWSRYLEWLGKMREIPEDA